MARNTPDPATCDAANATAAVAPASGYPTQWRQLSEAIAGAAPAQEDVVAYCIPYKDNICYCEDERQAIFINSEADLEEEEEVLQVEVEYEDDEIYWSAEEDNEDETADSAEASGVKTAPASVYTTQPHWKAIYKPEKNHKSEVELQSEEQEQEQEQEQE